MGKNRFPHVVSYLLLLGLLLTGVGFASAQQAVSSGVLARVGNVPLEMTWQIEVVDSGLGYYGGYSSLALDASGRPHIAYRDGIQGTLKYAYHDSNTWHIETVTNADTWGIALTLDTVGHPHICYRLYPSLKYAYHDGSSWHITTVDSTGDTGWDCSIALDAAGRPRIAYFDHTFDDLKYAAFNGSSWQIETVDSPGDVGRWASLEVDATDRPHIGYLDFTNQDLKYAYYNGSAWQLTTVDSVGYVGIALSLALDTAGRPHLSYWDVSNARLKHAAYDGTSWQIEVVDIGQYPLTSLAMDTAGRPHIAYYDEDNLRLKYAWYDGVVWQIEVVDSDYTRGYLISLDLDGADRPHISYSNLTGGELRYAQGITLPPPPPSPTSTPLPRPSPRPTLPPPPPPPPPPGGCNLYPITLHWDTVRGAKPGDLLKDILNGTRPGNFGWLTWTGDQSINALVRSLTPPGDSYTYINPDDPQDHTVSPGDWVYGRPGVADSRRVRAALDALKPLVITVPVWDQATGHPLNRLRYRVVGFAQIQIADYHLPGQNRISAFFWGWMECEPQQALWKPAPKSADVR